MPGPKSTTIPLPKGWTNHVRSAVLHVIALAQYATIYTRSWAANSLNARVRLKAENDRLQHEVFLLREEIRIKDARMLRIDPHKKPHHPPTERMGILELRAARGWSQQKTVDTFQITAATISQMLARAGLHPAPTTVGRILQEDPNPTPKPAARSRDGLRSLRR